MIVADSLQEFGSLVVADFDLTIIALSDSVLPFVKQTADQLVGTALEPLLTSLLDGSSRKLLKMIHAVIAEEAPSQVISGKIKNQRYYLRLSAYRGLVYIEWEKQYSPYISTSRMNKLSFLFDEIYLNNWDFSCQALYKLLRYDHVFVLQVQESGESKVIAEHAASGKPKFRGHEFSADFFPREAMPYYKSLSYRYIPDLSRLDQKLLIQDTRVHILGSQLAPPPKLHEAYLKSIGVCSAIFFPLYLDGKFWGMFVAHHPAVKRIDLQQRKLSTFIVQRMMNKFENSFQQGLLNHNQQLQEAEVRLKQSLRSTKTINCAMVENMALLTRMAKADGFAIYNGGDTFFHGDTPPPELFYELVTYFQRAIPKTVFKDYNFRLNHGHFFSETLPFAGLLLYSIGADNDYYLVWFRKEIVSSVHQLEEVGSGKDTQVKVWEQFVHDSARPWDEADIKFIDRLQYLINETIVGRAHEKQMLTEELRTLNNELEMFTFSLSHDLKNPLSILKMGLQFLQCRGEALSPDKRKEWLETLSGSVTSIEDIIDRFVNISQNKMTAMDKDAIPMSYTIKKILREAVLLFGTENGSYHLGRLLPLWGEKSALYQIFSNIIGNAIKYSSTQDAPQVWIDSRMEEQYVHYTIKDNGIGIPTETIPHIFDVFTRAANAQSFEGSGIGLTLVKRIMDRLGGSVDIQSSPGSGTSISLHFPLVSPFPPTML